MASEIKREPVLGNFRPSRAERAVAKVGRSKDKREDRDGNDGDHLAAIRKCPCCIPGCNKVGVDPHHLKSVPGTRGAGMRAPDRYVVPLCRFPHHEDVERIGSRGEASFFRGHGIDPIQLAGDLWGAPRGDAAAYTRIVLAHKGIGR